MIEWLNLDGLDPMTTEDRSDKSRAAEESSGPQAEPDTGLDAEEFADATDSAADAPPLDPIEALTAERDELFERLQRAAADHQNYIRQSQQNMTRLIGIERGDLLKSFLPVLEHFDQAINFECDSHDAQALMDGMKIVHDEMLKVFAQLGVTRVEAAVGEPFDPEIHEAMLRQEAEGIEPNHITLSMQPGYTYGNRTLRAAKVAVAPDED